MLGAVMFINRTPEYDREVINASPRYNLVERRRMSQHSSAGVVKKFTQAILKSIERVHRLVSNAYSPALTEDALRGKIEQTEFLYNVWKLLNHCEGTLGGSGSKIQTGVSPDYIVHQNNLLCYARARLKRTKRSVKGLEDFWKREREEHFDLDVFPTLKINPSVLVKIDWNANDEKDGKTFDQSSREVEQFEKENAQLLRLLEVEANQKESEQIEQKSEEVSQAVTFFNENVIEQAEVIGNIYDNVEDAVNLVYEGNAQLKQKEERSTSTQATIIIVLVVLTFSVLFLDWFHP